MKLGIDKVFPCILIFLDAMAGVVCIGTGDVKKGIYWLAAAVLNITVTF